MKSLMLLALFGLVSACASKRDIASVQDRETLEQQQHAQMIDGQASRIR